MKEEADNLMPVGERYVEKKPCDECQGLGFKTSDTTESCSNCAGAGWAAGPDGEPDVCPVCSGHRSVKMERRKTCKTCEGCGYHVFIMQDYEGDVPCESCDGSGKMACDCEGKGDQECDQCLGSGVCLKDQFMSTECKECNSRGYLPGSNYTQYSLKQWKEGTFAQRVTECFGSGCLDEMQEADKLYLEDGRILRISLCKMCGSKPNASRCPICNDKRIIWVHISDLTKCPKCMGFSATAFDKCDKCKGTGHCKCKFCNGELEIECSDCDGTGRQEGIVSRKV